MRGVRSGPWIAAAMLLQAAWLRWALVEPLPNSGNVGGRYNRSYFLWRLLPEVVPGLTWRRSYLGLLVGKLGHYEFLPQRLPMVLAASLIALAGMSLGRMVIRGLKIDDLDRVERPALTFALGMPLLGVVALVLGRMGLLQPWPTRAWLGVLAGWGVVDAIRRPPREKAMPAPPIWALLPALPFAVMMALGAMLPTIDFDALEYHIQGPKEYLLDGKISFLDHNVYTSMPFGVEMLHLLGMTALGDWWRGALAGQLLVMLHAPVAAAFIYSTARRWGSPRAAWVATVVYLTTPWVYRLGVLPYVEGPLCCYHAALIWSAGRAWSTVGNKSLIGFWGAAGVLAGGAMACKYPGLISAVVPFGAVAAADAWRRKSWRIAAVYGLGVAVVIGPWLVKNVIDARNPVYPLAFSVFGGPHWDAARDAQWSAAHGRRPVTLALLWEGIVEVAGRSDWQSPLYVALAPLALLRDGPRRLACMLVFFSLYIFATWWLLTHRLDRFYLPILPGLAILAGLGADWVKSRAWSAWLVLLLAITIAANLSYTSTALVGWNAWTEDLQKLRTQVPAEINPPLARLDATLPTDARTLLVGQAAVFHMNHRVIYNTVFDDEIIEQIARDKSPAEIAAELHRRGITHVYVDWHEVARHRKPGGYGFSPFVTPRLFRGLVEAGVLGPAVKVGDEHEVYEVRRSIVDRDRSGLK